MKSVYIYCEGQTEESFINEVLAPYFWNLDIYVYPIVCTTKRTSQGKHRGGVSSYQKVKKELQMIARGHPNECVTTMFDYYGMPIETPGLDCQEGDLSIRMEMIEAQIDNDIGARNSHFHFMVHEFEGLLFSDPTVFGLIADEGVAGKLMTMRNEFKTPEEINNSIETAPSKRILSLIPQYAKIKDGTRLSREIGIDRLREECPHFRKWIEDIRTWASEI